MLFTELISKYGIDINKFSAGIKKLIENYESTKETIAKLKKKLENPGLAEAKKTSYQADLKEAEDLLEEINKALLTKIQGWYDNLEARKEQGRKLAASRKAKANGEGAGSSAPAAPNEEGGGIGQPAATTSTGEGAGAGSSAPATSNEEGGSTGLPATTTTTPVKKKTPWGFIAAGALLFTAAIVAVVSYSNSQKKAA